jgi:hypothetical protein
MFETEYPEHARQAEEPDRYRDVPLGVEAAWPARVDSGWKDEHEPQPGGA